MQLWLETFRSQKYCWGDPNLISWQGITKRKLSGFPFVVSLCLSVFVARRRFALLFSRH